MTEKERKLWQQAIEVQFRYKLYNDIKFPYLQSLGCQDILQSFGNEEVGFIGVLLLFILYLIIIYRCFLITQKTKNNYGKILSGSLLLIFIMLFTINIGMCIGLFPVVGITLPLISQGGSSIVTTLALFGVIMSVGHKS
mgnify:CR=1 FL=1